MGSEMCIRDSYKGVLGDAHGLGLIVAVQSQVRGPNDVIKLICY